MAGTPAGLVSYYCTYSMPAERLPSLEPGQPWPIYDTNLLDWPRIYGRRSTLIYGGVQFKLNPPSYGISLVCSGEDSRESIFMPSSWTLESLCSCLL